MTYDQEFDDTIITTRMIIVDDLLIASEAPELSFNVVISKQAVVFIGTVLAIVPANYLKKIKTSIVKIDID